MSILNMYLSPKQAFIATDTLVERRNNQNKVIPFNYRSKMFYLPHLNICFFAEAYNNLGLFYFIFLQKYVIGDNIWDVINQTRSCQTEQKLSPRAFEKGNEGRIFVVGLYYVGNELQTFSILFKDGTFTIEQVYKPEPDSAVFVSFPNTDDKYYTDSLRDQETIYAMFTEMANDQKVGESVLPESNRNSIGGSLMITHLLVVENKLICQIHPYFDFADKTETTVAMWQNYHK